MYRDIVIVELGKDKGIKHLYVADILKIWVADKLKAIKSNLNLLNTAIDERIKLVKLIPCVLIIVNQA